MSNEFDIKCPYCGKKDFLYTSADSGCYVGECSGCNKLYAVKFDEKNVEIGTVEIRWVMKTMEL